MQVLRALGASRGAVDPLLVDAHVDDPATIPAQAAQWEAAIAESQLKAKIGAR